MMEPNKQQAIDVCQSRPFGHPPAEHVDLLPQNQILRLQFSSRLKQRRQNGKDQPDQVGHRDESLPRLFLASTPNPIFGTHNGRKPVIEPNEQKTIGIVQSWSLWHPSPKNVDSVAARPDFLPLPPLST